MDEAHARPNDNLAAVIWLSVVILSWHRLDD